ncbi:MAG: discoidin domain-containing protein [Peptostreptococcaceae bacterium]
MKFKSLCMLGLSVFLVGCSNSIVDKSIENTKLAIASGEYQKAEGVIQLALEESDKNETVNNLSMQVNKLLEIEKLIKDEKFDQAIVFCDELKQSKDEFNILNSQISKLESTIVVLQEEIEDKEEIQVKDEVEEKESIEEEIVTEQIERLNISYSTASSELVDNTSNSYSSSRAIDNDNKTIWSEGVSGPGINEWIEVSFNNIQNVKTIKLVNGHTSSENLYNANNRVKKLELSFSDGSSKVVDLKESTSIQEISLGDKGVDTSYIKMTILDVYKGSSYNDTCMGNIELFGVYKNEEVKVSDSKVEESNEDQDVEKIRKLYLDKFGLDIMELDTVWDDIYNLWATGRNYYSVYNHEAGPSDVLFDKETFEMYSYGTAIFKISDYEQDYASKIAGEYFCSYMDQNQAYVKLINKLGTNEYIFEVKGEFVEYPHTILVRDGEPTGVQ